MSAILTPERLRSALNYDPKSGEFVWRYRADMAKRWNTKNAGMRAGSRQNAGYVHISIDGKKYLAHRLAWLYVHGRWPTSLVDHIDLNRENNKIENLREADALDNSANVSVRQDNVSGYRGVCLIASRGKWHARITRDGRTVFLGSFTSREEGHRAYQRAAERLYGEYCPKEWRRS